jgi:hypothetical protein
MNAQFGMRELLIVLLAVFVGCLCISWLFSAEPFNEHYESTSGLEELEGMEEGEDLPYVNAETAAMVDGPGFEKTEDELSGIEEIPVSAPSNYYFLDDGADGEMSIQHNLCSKSCCSEQWPTPFKLKYDPYVCGSKDGLTKGKDGVIRDGKGGEFTSSRVFCNNT